MAEETSEGVPEGSLKRAELVITYYIDPEGQPVVNTSIHGDTSGDGPSYFEVVAMHAMSKDTIDQLFNKASQ